MYFSAFVQKFLYPISMKLFCNFIITWKRKRKVTSYFKDVCTKLPLKNHALYFLLLVNIFSSIICTVNEFSILVCSQPKTKNLSQTTILSSQYIKKSQNCNTTPKADLLQLHELFKKMDRFFPSDCYLYMTQVETRDLQALVKTWIDKKFRQRICTAYPKVIST